MLKFENEYFKVYEYLMENNKGHYYIYLYMYFDGVKRRWKTHYSKSLYEIIMKGYDLI